MKLIYALLARIKGLVVWSFRAFNELVWKVAKGGHWDRWGNYFIHPDVESLPRGCYNYVKVVGDVAFRVARHADGQDSSYRYLAAIHKLPAHKRESWMPKVYWVGRLFGHQCAVVEAVPHDALGHRWLRRDADGIDAILPPTSYSWEPPHKAAAILVHTVCKGFFSFMESIGIYEYDLHSGNYRLRNDGSVVITDPCT